MASTDEPKPTSDEPDEAAPASDQPAQSETEPASSDTPAEPTESAETAQPAAAAPPAEPGMFDNPPQSPLPSGYYTEDGVPTFDAVRDRIAQRVATADGQEVLDEDLPTERSARDEREALDKAGADRLAQLRKSMGLDK